MPNKRTFIAIDISAAVMGACETHINSLRAGFKDVRISWASPEKLHVTLKFLGDTEGSLISRLNDGIAAVAAKHRPFTLRLSRSGVFPSKSRPRILWIGIEDDSKSIPALYSSIEAVCEGVGFERETREFRPHLTIARIREPDRAAELAGAHLTANIEPIEFMVTEVVLYESRLGPTGSTYFPLVRRSFLGPI